MRRTTLMPAAVVMAMVTALAACAGAAAPPSDASDSELAASFGSCGSDDPGESSGAQSFLSTITSWQQVTAVEDAVRQGKGDQHTYPATMVTTSESRIEVRIHDSFWPGIDWALAHDDPVWIGLGVAGFDPDTVGTVMVLTPQDVFFAGRCADDIFTKPVHAAYGAATRDVMTRLTSATTKTAAQAVLGTTPVPTPSDVPPILAPGEGHDELLATLTSVSIHATISKALGVGETSPALCTHIAAGWSDCISTDDRTATKGFDFTGYVDTDGKLEFWLLGEDTDVTKPLVYLGTVQLPIERDPANRKKIPPTSVSVAIDTAKISIPDEPRSPAPDMADPGYIHVESMTPQR
ncbi:hypothetical protein [Cellulomonas sp. HZM]|uniref:hypothetical protein n=1 Tax=Cellulomonas sp. HZM TaxID=1454010 RepID=UPI0004930E76|nr:hypothetical protein [Cellulomonas sp. HZM]